MTLFFICLYTPFGPREYSRAGRSASCCCCARFHIVSLLVLLPCVREPRLLLFLTRVRGPCNRGDWHSTLSIATCASLMLHTPFDGASCLLPTARQLLPRLRTVRTPHSAVKRAVGIPHPPTAYLYVGFLTAPTLPSTLDILNSMLKWTCFCETVRFNESEYTCVISP